MRKTTKAGLAILILITSISLLPNSCAKTSTPTLTWQKEYGGATEFLSNLIQTSDGGFAFLDLGWYHQGHFQASTFYKLDSTGEIEWTKETNDFSALTVNQTSDGGYEVYGQWYPAGYYGQHDNYALLKLDSQGNVQWNINYSSPNNLPGKLSLTQIPISNGGTAYVNSSNLIVTDSNNQVIWSQPTTIRIYSQLPGYESFYDVLPFSIDSLVETSDGGVAGLGICFPSSTNAYGPICLVKTNAFLPPPTQEPLPTPVPTPTATPAVPEVNWSETTPWIAALLVLAAVFCAALIIKRHRKTANLKQ